MHCQTVYVPFSCSCSTARAPESQTLATQRKQSLVPVCFLGLSCGGFGRASAIRVFLMGFFNVLPISKEPPTCVCAQCVRRYFTVCTEVTCHQFPCRTHFPQIAHLLLILASVRWVCQARSAFAHPLIRRLNERMQCRCYCRCRCRSSCSRRYCLWLHFRKNGVGLDQGRGR